MESYYLSAVLIGIFIVLETIYRLGIIKPVKRNKPTEEEKGE